MIIKNILILLLSLSQITYAQDRDILVKQNKIGIQIKGCVLPKANINTLEGKYQLQSRIQSAFSAGVTYQPNPNNAWDVSTGLQLELTNWNFFIHIPDSDLNGYLSTEGAPQIENKEVHFKIALPVQVVHQFGNGDHGSFGSKAGIKINYSGFSPDESITTWIADTNFNFTKIFHGEFKSDNNKKPWVSFLVSVFKSFYLKNNHQLSIELGIEYSDTRFIKGDYEIILPNKPITRGAYSVTGSSVGLGIQYHFI